MDTAARAWLGQRGGPPAGIPFRLQRLIERVSIPVTFFMRFPSPLSSFRLGASSSGWNVGFKITIFVTEGAVAQWQRVGFQTRRLGVRFSPASLFLLFTSFTGIDSRSSILVTGNNSKCGSRWTSMDDVSITVMSWWTFQHKEMYP
jgi:hypothetical protein